MSENEKAVKQPKPHRFKQGINVVQPISSVGDIAYQSAKREIEDSDEDFRGGLQEVKKYGMPAMDGYPSGAGNWVEGTKVVCVDGNGNVLSGKQNNIKDCLAMAYVIMDGDFDSNTTARDDLIKDLWELMNPEITYTESDIYTCPYGCASFAYNCDSSEDYSTMEGYTSNGVGFYGSIEGYSEYGDGYEVTCKGCKDDKNKTIYHDKQSGTGEAEPAQGCTNYDVNYSCDGHSVGVCYGHKNIEVHMTVYQLEEMFVNNLLPEAEGKSYKGYLSQFEGWTADNVEWARLIVDSIWKDLYGIDPDEI